MADCQPTDTLRSPQNAFAVKYTLPYATDAELTALGITRLQWKAYGYRADVVLVKGGGQQPCLSLRARQYILLLHGGLQWRVA